MSLKDTMHKEKRYEPTSDPNYPKHKEMADALENANIQTGAVMRGGVPYVPSSSSTIDLLQQREYTHGDFETNAICAESMFAYWEDAWKASHKANLPPYPMRLAIRMVCFKLARIASNPHPDEHYDDVKGYIELARRYRK